MALLGSATSQIFYTASKGGVLAMSRELGVRFARQGIRVNALSPGPVDLLVDGGISSATVRDILEFGAARAAAGRFIPAGA